MCKVSRKIRKILVIILTETLKHLKPYARINHKLLSEALIDYYLGLSLRASSSKYGFSHVTLWRYWHQLKHSLKHFKVRAVAMDETGFKYMGQKLFVWFLVDMEGKLLVDVHLTVNSRTAYDVLSITRQLGLDVEYVHDGGSWYKALDWVGARHRRERFGRRSLVEYAFRSLKHRIKRFNCFRGCLDRALSWLRSFAYMYNLVILVTQGVMAM